MSARKAIIFPNPPHQWTLAQQLGLNGLRNAEILALTKDDVVLDTSRPNILITLNVAGREVVLENQPTRCDTMHQCFEKLMRNAAPGARLFPDVTEQHLRRLFYAEAESLTQGL